MSYEQILYELSDTTAVVTINRPDKMNTWNADVASELSQALGQANMDDNVRAVVITGAGRAFCAGADLERGGETFAGRDDKKSSNSEAPVLLYPYQIDKNCLPHCDDFQENGYTREEMKVYYETKKIMGDDRIDLSCTAVRVPVEGGHSEAVFLELKSDFELDEVRKELSNFPGVILEDEPNKNIYPMPLHSKGRDEVFVGRIRRDLANPRGLHLWIVSDNLRKGAATNTIQIAEYLNEKGRWDS